jgi:hypothetical protein
MKFMIDECMGTKSSRLLAGLMGIHKPPIEAHFLEDYLKTKGTYDIDWTEILEREGGWSVVTCDHRSPQGTKAKSKGPPLNLILPARKITGFFLSGRMAQKPGFEKARSVIYMFPEICECVRSAIPGTRFKINAFGTGYRIVEWPLKSTLPVLPPIALPLPVSLWPDAASPTEPSPAPAHPSPLPTSPEPPPPGS